MSGRLLVQGGALTALAAQLRTLSAAVSPRARVGPRASDVLQEDVRGALAAFEASWQERRQELTEQLAGAAAGVEAARCTYAEIDESLGRTAPRHRS